MLILHDPDTLLHSTIELLGSKFIPALESPDRIRAIVSAVEASEHELRIIHVDQTPPNTTAGSPSLLDIVTQTHDAGYIDHLSHVFTEWLKAGLVQPNESVVPECFRLPTARSPNPPHPPHDIFARPGYYSFDMSANIMSDSYTSIIASANLAYQAVHLLFSPSPSLDDKSSPQTILALCRPPGHHCSGHQAGGYCYINNAAVAISTFHSLSSSSLTNAAASKPRTAILDLDFHHGNGTQELYYSSSSELYVSIHGENEFPYYTGSTAETGSGEGEGYNLNLPLPTGSSFEAYLEKLQIALERVREFKPECLVVSLGFDTFRLDPIGKFDIDSPDYEVMAAEVRKCLLELKRAHEVRCLILLEGGYIVERLGGNMLSFLRGWRDA